MQGLVFRSRLIRVNYQLYKSQAEKSGNTLQDRLLGTETQGLGLLGSLRLSEVIGGWFVFCQLETISDTPGSAGGSKYKIIKQGHRDDTMR